MRNIFKKGLMLVAGCLLANSMWATPIANLNFEITSSTTALPTDYVYSAANKPSIKTQNNIKCIIISDGGGSTAPTFNDPAAPSGGKRWMAFCPDVDCSVTIGIMSNRKEFFINDKTGKKFSYTNTANVVEEKTFTGLKAGQWYAMCGGSSQVYITKMSFQATASVAVTGVTVSPTDTTVERGATVQLTATITPQDATNKKVTWTSSNDNVATVDAANGLVSTTTVGTATITATTVDGGFTASCSITVTSAPDRPVTSIALDKPNITVKENQTETLTVNYTPANANVGRGITWTTGNANIATVNNGIVTGVSAGNTTITATSEGGFTATCAVTVEEASPVPYTDLTTHVPEVYEAKEIAGGYGGTLSEFQGREYEVYYINRDGDSKLDVAIKNTDKQGCITNSTGGNSMAAKDGWFTVKSSGSGGDSNAAAKEEYGQSIRKINIVSGDEVKLHVRGFDQFSFYGKDNSNNGTKNFEVYINDVKQTMTIDKDNYTIRRFTLDGESVIRVTAIGASNNTFVAFSLRLAQEPRTKWLSGNDSTQVILQTTAPKPVYYATKYNNIPNAETVLEWIGAEATGIGLTKIDGTLTDTLVLSGNANCTTGVYHYAVVAKYNGVETSRAEGSFTVKSDIKATTDINATVFNNEEMDLIKFKYYALNERAVQLTWPNGQPTGIGGSGSNGTYTISGTPNVSGTLPQDFIYQITVTGADTTITGKITVKELVHTEKDVLYLYKNTYSTPIYDYIKAQGWNPIERKALDNLRGSDQYSYYKWALISEDVDADNGEILALSQGKGHLPVLSMKSFSYTPGRLNWGEPDNGSLTENGRYITVQRDDHPIFKAMNKKRGDRIQVLDSVAGKGLMPIDVYYTGTLCLATALTRDIEDYYGDGYQQTLLHEVPAEINFNQKYICLPIGMEGCKHLSGDGKKLLNECIKYITSTQPTIYVPSTAITTFQIGNYRTDFSREAEGIITIHVPVNDSALMKAATPQIELADPMTFVTPSSGEAVDFTNWHYGVRYMVSDYINKRYYDVIVRLYDPEGIENIEAGTWVNIFDIFGRKVTTTNEDLRTIDLPSGMYIVVTEDGQTMKIMR